VQFIAIVGSLSDARSVSAQPRGFHFIRQFRRIAFMIRVGLLICGLLLTSVIGSADWRQLQAVDSGTAILVNSGFLSDAGKLVSSTADSVIIETRNGHVTVARDDIDEVFVFRSRHDRMRSGLLWGGVAAGVTAAVIFPIFARLTNPSLVAPTTLTATNGVSIGLTRYMSGKTKRIYHRKN
jgi:hypothetical protein